MKRVELSHFVPVQGLTRVEMPRKAFNLNPHFDPEVTRDKSAYQGEITNPWQARLAILGGAM